MLFSAIGSLGDRLDSKFITAYFFPAFVAVLGTIAILVTAIGGERFAERIAQFDSAATGHRGPAAPAADPDAGADAPRDGATDRAVLCRTRLSPSSSSSRPFKASSEPVPAPGSGWGWCRAVSGSSRTIPPTRSPRPSAMSWPPASTTHASSMPWRRITGGRGCCHSCRRVSGPVALVGNPDAGDAESQPRLRVSRLPGGGRPRPRPVALDHDRRVPGGRSARSRTSFIARRSRKPPSWCATSGLASISTGTRF